MYTAVSPQCVADYQGTRLINFAMRQYTELRRCCSAIFYSEKKILMDTHARTRKRRCKYTDVQIETIHERHCGGKSIKELARIYAVHPSTVRRYLARFVDY